MTQGTSPRTRGPLRTSSPPPIKPLGRAAPATSSTTAPTVAPWGSPPSAAVHFRTALGSMGTVGRQPDCELFAFILGS